MIQPSSIVAVSGNQASCNLGDGEAAILNVQSGVYFGLEGVGSFIWQLIFQPRSVAAIRDEIIGNYDVEPSICEIDLLSFLAQLEQQGLIEASDEAL